MKKKIIIASVSVVLVILAIIIFFVGFYFGNLKPVNINDTNKVTFTVEAGTSIKQLIDNLDQQDLINNRYVGYIYVKINKVTNIQAGEYSLRKNMSLKEIMDIICNGRANIDTVTIQFIEGKRLTRYVSDITKKFDYTEQDILKVLDDTDFLNECINKYWFISDDIKNTKLYYPLEGYLFADTYTFYSNASIKDIIFKMLDTMATKLEPYRTQIEDSDLSVHEILTLASIIELEGNSKEDRATISQVFQKRLKIGMTLGSDVTTYYAAKKALSESLTQAELDACNNYNTRGTCVSGLPVGPIATPSLESIDAVFNPSATDYLYFVADSAGKVYFASDSAGHLNNVREHMN